MRFMNKLNVWCQIERKREKQQRKIKEKKNRMHRDHPCDIRKYNTSVITEVNIFSKHPAVINRIKVFFSLFSPS